MAKVIVIGGLVLVAWCQSGCAHPEVEGKIDPSSVESALQLRAVVTPSTAPVVGPTEDWPFKKKTPSGPSPEATAAARKWLKASGTPLTADEFAKAAGACDVEKVKLFVAAGIGEAERQKALDYRLSVATTNSRCDDVVSELAKSGVKLNGDHLLQAVVAGQRDNVSVVLGSGVDVNYAASDGSTAAITAARVRNMGVMELLRDGGADLIRGDRNGTTPLMVSTDLGDIGMVRFVLATPHLEVNRRDSAGRTALHLARLSRSARRLPQVRWDDLIDVLEKAGAAE
jgi:ankyrin repeat protein